MEPTRQVLYKGMVSTFVRLENLKPGTAYYFVIRDNDGKSPRFWFKTAPNKPEPFTFIAGGDSRNYRNARRRANTMVSKLRPLYVSFGGDFTDRNSDGQWKAWFDDWQYTISKDGRMYPILVTRGNHERNNEVLVNLFDVENKNIFYALSFGGNLLRHYILNTDILRGGDQSAWFERDLVKNDSTLFKVVQYHKPIRPHLKRKKPQESQYRIWAPLFYSYGINLSIECDSHCAKRTWPIRPTRGPDNDQGFVRDEKGTVFIGAGCWGAPLRDPDYLKEWTRDVGKFNQFSWIHVSPESMNIYTIKVDNVSRVPALTEDNLFEINKKLAVWEPKNGALIKINNKKRDQL